MTEADLARRVLDFQEDFAYAPDDWVLAPHGTSRTAMERLNELVAMALDVVGREGVTPQPSGDDSREGT